MKNQISLIVVTLFTIYFGENLLSAQNTATTTVNITLVDVFAIDQSASTAAFGVVNFYYSTAEGYNSDQTVNVPANLVVTSTNSFYIKVEANGANFESGSDNIPVKVMAIMPVMTGTTNMTGTSSNVVLSTTDQTPISGTDLGSARIPELDNHIPKAKSYSPAILGKPEGTYTQTVTYTATAH